VSDRGAKALAERTLKVGARAYAGPYLSDRQATAILGEHGLFIRDASGHEPTVIPGPVRACSCGWVNPQTGESYFDHLGS
jgi:hypothetical protein